MTTTTKMAMSEEEIKERNERLESRGYYRPGASEPVTGGYTVEGSSSEEGSRYAVFAHHNSQSTAGASLTVRVDGPVSRYFQTALEAFEYIEQFLDAKEAVKRVVQNADADADRKKLDRQEAFRIRQEQERVARAHIPDALLPLRTVNGTVALDGLNAPAQAVEEIEDWIKHYRYHFDRCEGLVFCGAVGTDKTRLACALVESLARAEHVARYSNVAEVVHTTALDAPSNPLHSPAFLVVDGLGASYSDEQLGEMVRLAAVRDLRALLQARWNTYKPTMLICDRSEDWLRWYLGPGIFEGEVVTTDRVRKREWRFFTFELPEKQSVPKTPRKRAS